MGTERYYVKNKDLLAELTIYREENIMTDNLGMMIKQIATNYSNKGNFASYTWREDIISEAVLTCLRYMHNFDPNKMAKPNPFAYFTTVIHNAFINYIRKQNKHSEIKDVCYKKAHILDEDNFHFTPKAIDYRDLRKYDKPVKRKKKKK